MANIAFDFLTESLLFNDYYISDSFSTVTENELRLELRKYREYIERHFDDINNEVTQNKQN